MKEAVAGKSSIKKEFLKISQNTQENTSVVASFLIKLQAFSKNTFFMENLVWLPLS